MSGGEREPITWIGYTTRYRAGGARLLQVARTMAREASGPVECVAVETKRDFVRAMAELAARGDSIGALDWIGHAGMYGPMFGTRAHPEQFSPHEWRALAAAGALPLGLSAEASFHACRSARWFAPFFARTFGRAALGFHGYTAFSTRPDRFARVRAGYSGSAPLYLFGAPSRKSHGWLGAVRKHAGRQAPEAMTRFDPSEPNEGQGSYDPVARLYAAAFEEIRVRRDEWRWLCERLRALARPGGLEVLDVGCGSGAMLRALEEEGLLRRGVGVDRSAEMIAIATERGSLGGLLSYETIDGPRLPFPDASFDVVTSLLSFRYLDWDPIVAEIARILRPGGRLLVVDMAAAPVHPSELGALARGKLADWIGALRAPAWREARRRLVARPEWAEMLRYNPVRSEHEFTWYLESRFPGRRVERLNVGRRHRVLAFDSGPIDGLTLAPQSYP